MIWTEQCFITCLKCKLQYIQLLRGLHFLLGLLSLDKSKFSSLRFPSIDIRNLKQNSRGWRHQCQQNNDTNYTRQKAHMNMWNKADICAVLLSNETSTAPFPHCLQNVADISTSIFTFRKRSWSYRILARIETIYLKNMRIAKKCFHYLPMLALPSSFCLRFLLCLCVLEGVPR